MMTQSDDDREYNPFAWIWVECDPTEINGKIGIAFEPMANDEFFDNHPTLREFVFTCVNGCAEAYDKLSDAQKAEIKKELLGLDYNDIWEKIRVKYEDDGEIDENNL